MCKIPGVIKTEKDTTFCALLWCCHSDRHFYLFIF